MIDAHCDLRRPFTPSNHSMPTCCQLTRTNSSGMPVHEGMPFGGASAHLPHTCKIVTYVTYDEHDWDW